MKKILLTMLLMSGVFITAWGEGTKNYYANVTVSASSGKGLVYASESSATPAAGDYKESMVVSLKDKTSETTDLYLFAKANTEGEELQYWLDDKQNKIMDPKISVKGSTDSNAPATYTYTAVFGAPIAVKVSSNNTLYGTVSISNAENKIGDEITLTAKVSKVPSYGCRNLMIRFKGWKTADGEELSSEPTYTFTATEKMEITGEFENLNSIKASGYYRVRNIFNRVLAIEGNFPWKNQSPAYLEGLVRWTLPDDYVAADFANKSWNGSDDNPAVDAESLASAVFWMEGESLNLNAGPDGTVLEKVNVYGQGTDINTMTGHTFTLKEAQASTPGYHYLYGGFTAGFKMTHYEMDEDHDLDGKTDGHFMYCRTLIGRSQAGDPYSWMAIQPIDEEHFDDFWFGASAHESMEYQGGYWTSMYTGFPYECRDGVEAYYVKGAVMANNVNYLQLTKIESGVVPANSAVLLKCRGLRSRENRLMPLNFREDYGTLEGNMLEGSFSLYTEAVKQSDPAGSNTSYAYYVKSGRPRFTDNLRAFSVNGEGNIGFYKIAANEDGSAKMLEPNKVYLDVNKLPESTRQAPIRISITDATGINDAAVEGNPFMDDRIYDLYGREVRNPEPRTIYIRNGKKFIMR